MSLQFVTGLVALLFSAPLLAGDCPDCETEAGGMSAVPGNRSGSFYLAANTEKETDIASPSRSAQAGTERESDRDFTEDDFRYVCSRLSQDCSADEIIKFAKDRLPTLMKKHICYNEMKWGGKRTVLEMNFISIQNRMTTVVDFLNYFKDHKMFDEMGEILNNRDDEGRTTLDYLDYVKSRLTVPANVERLEKLAFYFCAFRGRYSAPEKNKTCHSRY